MNSPHDQKLDLARLQAALWPLDQPRPRIPESGYRPEPPAQGRLMRQAAVLVPILQRMEQRSVLFTVRSAGLRQHPGQISFPGGSIDDSDANAVAAALRETEEEVGIRPEAVQPLGLLDYFNTITGFRILPVVAHIREPGALRHNEEVAQTFEVPLDQLLQRHRYQSHEVRRQGRVYQLYAYQHGPYRIWGATAAMLVNLIERLEQQPG